MSNRNDIENTRKETEKAYDAIIFFGGSLLVSSAYILYLCAEKLPVDSNTIGALVSFTVGSVFFPPLSIIGGIVSIPIIGYSSVKLIASLFM